jgi:hypothetical protein
MNTSDVKVKGLINSFDDLYKYAKEQFLMYEELEGIKDWESYDFCIDCPEDQAKFKDMLQIRFIEELTEATKTLDNVDHLKEELTDALNFFLSAYIMVGADFNKLPDPDNILPPRYYLENGRYLRGRFESLTDIWAETYSVVEAVGYLCNLLKNRPWAQSNYLVSMLDFDKRLSSLWVIFWGYLHGWGLDSKTIFEMFERKFEVNKFRTQTGY